MLDRLACQHERSFFVACIVSLAKVELDKVKSGDELEFAKTLAFGRRQRVCGKTHSMLEEILMASDRSPCIADGEDQQESSPT